MPGWVSAWSLGSFALDRLSAGTYEIRVVAPGAQRVEIMADFTDWSVRPLAPGGADTWSLALPISPGIHQINLRIDGGRWQVPPGLQVADDGFSGKVGVLVVN
jgi:1,4-alpha-glucan branching enzyme